MPDIWVPSSAQDDQRAAHAASLARALSNTSGYLDYWNKKIKEKDEHCQLVKASENATHPGLKPGYYHVLRTPPNTLPSIHVHQTPSGEFLEPNEGLLKMLEEGDMWSARAMRIAKEEREKQEASAQRAQERETEERQDEIYERLRSAFGTSIAVPR